jgi:ribosomal protein L11 methyltransferase
MQPVTYTAVQIQCDEETGQLLIAILEEIFTSFEENKNGITGYVEAEAFEKDKFQTLIEPFSNRIQTSFTEILEENWNQQWEENFDPIRIDDQVYIRATFHKREPSFPIEIIINPKMSFGTGHHATTILMIRAMMELEMNSKYVLDVGTGTGVLAILASKLGAKSVLATDIDTWSIENSQENFGLNQMSIQTLNGVIKDIHIGEPIDILLANINRNVLIGDIATFSQILCEKGQLILSGFYVNDANDIIEECINKGFEVQNSYTQDSWAALVFKKLR